MKVYRVVLQDREFCTKDYGFARKAMMVHVKSEHANGTLDVNSPISIEALDVEDAWDDVDLSPAEVWDLHTRKAH
jgi:hypothetical protein